MGSCNPIPWSKSPGTIILRSTQEKVLRHLCDHRHASLLGPKGHRSDPRSLPHYFPCAASDVAKSRSRCLFSLLDL